MPNRYRYSTLKDTWIPSKKYFSKTKETFGSFSIKAAVRGSYCPSCKNYNVYGVN